MRTLFFLALIAFTFSACKQSNCESLVHQRNALARAENPNLELISKTDSLIVNYCK